MDPALIHWPVEGRYLWAIPEVETLTSRTDPSGSSVYPSSLLLVAFPTLVGKVQVSVSGSSTAICVLKASPRRNWPLGRMTLGASPMLAQPLGGAIGVQELLFGS